MKYGLLFYETDTEFLKRDGGAAAAYWGAWGIYIDLLATEGVLVHGAGAALHPPLTATTLRVNGGTNQIQDGPIADAKEQLGGFVLIDVANLDQAMKWASKAPCAETGGVEIRPVLPDPGS